MSSAGAGLVLGLGVTFAESPTVGSDWLANGPMKRKLLPKTWRSKTTKQMLYLEQSMDRERERNDREKERI